MATDLKETPLHAEHDAQGARMVPFAGWRMPVQYEGILPEHRAVRASCGVFDISHMGQLFVEGPKAATWLERQLTNAVDALAPGQAHYTLLLHPNGGVIDDLILYRLAGERFLLLVNAAKLEEDTACLRDRLDAGVHLDNRSADYAGLAVQGPRAADVAAQLWPEHSALPDRNHVRILATPQGEAFLCRTGYTGEDGFELFVPNAMATDLWKTILAADVTPCGLGARDTLRLEMGYPLNGADLSPEHSPLEAGLGFFVSLAKPVDFVGKGALIVQREAGLPSRLTGLIMPDKGPPLRHGYAIMKGDEKLAELTSGCLSPSLGHGIGMAYLPSGHTKPGLDLEVDIRGRRFPVTTVKKPFYHPKKS